MKLRPKRIAVNLDEHRLDGDIVSAGCISCPLREACGGYTRRGGGWSCMDRCQHCDPTKCDLVCMKKPRDFARALLEVGGFGFEGVPPLLSITSNALPRYIPVVQHGGAGRLPLDWVALPLRALMRIQHGVYRPIAHSASELRAALGLMPGTKIVLLGTGKDRPIETYWRYRRRDAVPSMLAPLALTCAIAPNYSLFLEDPRTQHMFNRKRSLICAHEWSDAGVPSIPYLQTVSPADWRYWERFLRQHHEVTIVAKEFQTGLASPVRGEDAIAQLARVQDTIGRRLHLLAIGAARYRRSLDAAFDSWTLLDSVPFMKAVKRRVAGNAGRRVNWSAARGDDVARLMVHNVSTYSEWLAQRSTA